MKLFVSETNETMSKQAAETVIQLMQSRRRPVICAASGHSPEGLYKEIIDRVRHTKVREELDAIVWDRLEQNPLVGANNGG